jgi:L-alanine-DL-glutamate epimerase-like enolase superfamily enzyme
MTSSPDLSRRTFLRTALAAGAGTALAPATAWGTSPPAAPTIECITVLRVPGSFYRPVAMNAYDDAPKGKAGTVRMVRLVLSDGTTGVGVEGYDRIDDATVQGLQERVLGTNPLAMYRWDGDRIQGVAPDAQDLLLGVRYAWLESALLDAIGRLKAKPVYALFGDPVRAGVDAYDGTLYFKDVERDAGPEVVGEVAARIQADGYRALKMKVGRPYKWMEGETGVERDIAAVQAARAAVGPSFALMADANNGYQDRFEAGLRFMRATKPDGLYWMEELMPESMDQNRRLREALRTAGVPARLAEGENAFWDDDATIQAAGDVAPWFEQGLIDVVQPDLRTVGFSNTLAMADHAARHGGTLVPHNWQSEMGKLMGIHAARLRRNVPFVEDDRWSNYALDASDYRFREGQWHAPDTPGWGVRVTEHYERFAEAAEERVIE